MNKEIIFRVFNCQTRYEELNVIFKSFELAIDYATVKSFSHVHEYYGGHFKKAYDIRILKERALNDSRLEGVRTIYKKVKKDNGVWGDWFEVEDMPKISDYDASGIKFYFHTRNYTIETLNGTEGYYIEY